MLRVIDLMQCRKASNSNSWLSHSLPFTFFFSLSSSLSHLLNAFDVHKVSEKSMCNFFSSAFCKQRSSYAFLSAFSFSAEVEHLSPCHLFVDSFVHFRY